MPDALSRVRSARTAEQIAEDLAKAIEPLAQSMTRLADDLRSQVAASASASSDQAAAWSKAQASASASASAAAAATLEQAKQAVRVLNEATQQARSAARTAAEVAKAGWSLRAKHWLLAGCVGVATGVLTSACWIWLRPSPPAPVVNLDAAQVAQYLMTNGGLTCPRTEQRRR